MVSFSRACDKALLPWIIPIDGGSVTPSSSKAEIAELLAIALAAQPGQVAAALAREMGVAKGVLNPVLYHDERFVRSDEDKPRWYLRSDAELAPSIATSPSVGGRAASERSEEVLDVEEDFDEEIDPQELARFAKVAAAPRLPYRPVVEDALNPHALYEWQREALIRWRDNEYRGIIDAVTGAGKTRLAVAAIDDHQRSGGRTLVLVPTIVLLHQWFHVLSESLPGVRIGRVGDGHDDDLDTHEVVVAVVASARTRVFRLRGEPGLLVVDECHRSASEKNQEALDDRFVKRLGLSATHERMDNAHQTVLLPYFGKVVTTLGYQRAIAEGVITNVRVAFVGVEFTDEEMARYNKLVHDLKTLQRTLVRTWGCRRGPFSLFLDDVLRLTRKGPLKASMVANRWLTLWREKRELLAETPAKMNAVTGFAGSLADADRALLFTQSILSANELALKVTEAGVSTQAHHSNLSSEERHEIMKAFAQGTTKVLASVQTLEEGVDVPDADLAVIVASSKQRRQMIQRMGRVMRRKHDGRDARFLILFVKGTDEDPRKGAHELFVEELLEVARESAIFEAGQRDEVRSFLDPQRW